MSNPITHARTLPFSEPPIKKKKEKKEKKKTINHNFSQKSLLSSRVCPRKINLPIPLQFSLVEDRANRHDCRESMEQQRRCVSLDSSRDTPKRRGAFTGQASRARSIRARSHQRSSSNTAGPARLRRYCHHHQTRLHHHHCRHQGRRRLHHHTAGEQRRSRGEGPRGFSARSQLADMSRARWGSRCLYAR